MLENAENKQLEEIPPGRKDDLTIRNAIGKILSTEEYPKVFHKVPVSTIVSDPMTGPDLMHQFDAVDGVDGIEQPLSRNQQFRELDITKRVKDFIGDITHEEFESLDSVMSKDIMFRGGRLTTPSALQYHQEIFDKLAQNPENSNLKTHQALKSNQQPDNRGWTLNFLRYRGDKFAATRSFRWMEMTGEDDMVPGQVVLYYVKVYRPFPGLRYRHYTINSNSKKAFNGMVAQQEITLHGGQTLCDLRDYIKCPNDYGPRHDVSDNPSEDYIENLKDVFPSGCLFINNTFYNDTRNVKSIDLSENIRKWTKAKKLASLEARDMDGVTLDSLVIRLGHPELYLHQGSCEHVFTFTQIRLLHPSDVCVSTAYPISTLVAQFKANMCIICAGYTAQWIVTNNDRIPFDPAYLCNTCFKMYNYVDGRKIGNFKAYRNYDKNSLFG